MTNMFISLYSCLRISSGSPYIRVSVYMYSGPCILRKYGLILEVALKWKDIFVLKI